MIAGLVKELARWKQFRRFASGKKEDREARRNKSGALAGFVVSQGLQVSGRTFYAVANKLVVKEDKKK
jgi:hypothetical protein